MRNYSDVKTDIVHDYSFIRNSISLSKLVDSPIKDVIGAIDNNYGEYVFTARLIVLENGKLVDLQGEHDIVYAFDYDRGVLPSDEELKNIYKTDPDNKHNIDDDK